VRAVDRMGAKATVVEEKKYHDHAWTLDQVS
jgi:hypothetical protein